VTNPVDEVVSLTEQRASIGVSITRLQSSRRPHLHGLDALRSRLHAIDLRLSVLRADAERSPVEYAPTEQTADEPPTERLLMPDLDDPDRQP
jgi:hypothetical protein